MLLTSVRLLWLNRILISLMRWLTLPLEEGIEIGMKIADFIFNNSVDFSKVTEAYVNGVFALVFDNQTGQVVWYGKRPRRYEYNPLDRESLTKQLTKLFADFK